MSLTSAVANAAAAAAAAGAGKKAAQLQLQAELNNDDEWHKFVNRDGLLVVDVYTEWCGPCIGMVGNLKKIKVELGGDNLHLAVVVPWSHNDYGTIWEILLKLQAHSKRAKADTIECLKRFRNRSEPTWMFLAAGQLLNVVFGADAPRIARTIETELQNEVLARKGERERPQRAPHELTPPEQEVADAQEKLQEERRAKEAAAAEASRLARREARAKRVETYFLEVCPALMMPHSQKHLRKVSDTLEPYGVVVADKCPLVLGKDGARILAVEQPELGTEAAAAALAERPALALLLKKLPDREGSVIELARKAICGDGLDAEDGTTPPKILAEELRADSIPGIFVPADRHQRAAALDLLFPKMISSALEPPAPAEPPHIAVLLGAWQRRAVLAIAEGKLKARLLRYGFFADDNLQEPKLIAKTIDKYEERTEKEYSETIVLMIGVGVAEPALADPSDLPPPGPPTELLSLGPLHVSEDSVVGAEECARFFPPGYSEPEHRPKPKTRKKKKKRHGTKDDTLDESAGDPPSCDVTDVDNGDAEGEDGEGEGDGEAEGEEDTHVDKATSPPPLTPH